CRIYGNGETAGSGTALRSDREPGRAGGGGEGSRGAGTADGDGLRGRRSAADPIREGERSRRGNQSGGSRDFANAHHARRTGEDQEIAGGVETDLAIDAEERIGRGSAVADRSGSISIDSRDRSDDARGIHLAHAAVAGVGDVQVSGTVDCETLWTREGCGCRESAIAGEAARAFRLAG